MINRQFSSELAAQPHYAQAAVDIVNAMEQHGTMSTVTQHHEFTIPVPEGLASDQIADLDISIADTFKPNGGRRSIFQLAARCTRLPNVRTANILIAPCNLHSWTEVRCTSLFWPTCS